MYIEQNEDEYITRNRFYKQLLFYILKVYGTYCNMNDL